MEDFFKLLKEVNHFDRENGMTFEVHSPGHITYHMTITEKHLSSPHTSHGAAIAGFMDCVLGLSALSISVPRSQLTSTVEFKINYIKPAHLGDKLTGIGTVQYHGKSLIIATAEIKRGDEMIAIGQGTFNTYPMSKKGIEL